jgi:hypothetical protein
VCDYRKRAESATVVQPPGQVPDQDTSEPAAEAGRLTIIIHIDDPGFRHYRLGGSFRRADPAHRCLHPGQHAADVL